jgi:hypothetical protein
VLTALSGLVPQRSHSPSESKSIHSQSSDSEKEPDSDEEAPEASEAAPENEEAGDSENSNGDESEHGDLPGHKWTPPLIPACNAALTNLIAILSPQRVSGIGHKHFDGDDLLQKWLEMMWMFLWTYCEQAEPVTWIKASEKIAHLHQKGRRTAQNLCTWSHSFIESRTKLPINLYGTWNTCLLEKGNLVKEIYEHLQGIGKYIRAEDIVHFLDQLEVK